MVVGYHCGISNDFSTALGRESQGSTVSPGVFFGSWRFVVGDSKLKHDFDEAIKGFFCGKMALYKAFSRRIFFIYCNPAVFKVNAPMRLVKMSFQRGVGCELQSPPSFRSQLLEFSRWESANKKGC